MRPDQLHDLTLEIPEFRQSFVHGDASGFNDLK
jgi:hypothetical protein